VNNFTEFLQVFVFAIVGIAFTLVAMAIAYLLSPRTQGKKTFATYECGIEPYGSAWIRYSVHYYIYALIFIAFDVDVLYLFPVALSYTRGAQPFEFYSLLIFILILGLAVAYAWGKGVFTWKRRVL
jgi:NADH-quinone oxidoreductase subunit A